MMMVLRSFKYYLGRVHGLWTCEKGSFAYYVYNKRWVGRKKICIDRKYK